eukprot:7454159-Lingulodinium_polyedra.AAC.1
MLARPCAVWQTGIRARRAGLGRAGHRRNAARGRTPSQRAPWGSVGDLALALGDEHCVRLKQPSQFRLE